MKPFVTFFGYPVSRTDFTRFIIIATLSVACFIITLSSLSRSLETLYAQLFYFPIVYATYFYPRKGLWLAGACAVLYEVFGYLYIFPDTGGLIYVTGQAILFICVAALVAFISERLNTSEARSRSIVEKAQSGIILFDQNTLAIHLTNAHLEKMLGFSGEELAGMTFSQLFSTTEDRERFFASLKSGGETQNIETIFVTRDKGPIWVNLSTSRITENLVSCTVIDINKFKLAKQAADEIDSQYKQVADNFPTSIVIIRNQMIVYSNPSFEEFSGYSRKDLMGKDPISLIHPVDHEDFRQCQSSRRDPVPATGQDRGRYPYEIRKDPSGYPLFHPDTAG